jgi:hypothetical protein
MRIPIYDFYYIDDPLSVPEHGIPDSHNLITFMGTPKPIAALIEFLKQLDISLGHGIAEISHKLIESRVSSS